MTTPNPFPWSDAEIRNAAADMIASHNGSAIAKSDEIIRRLKSEGLFSLARTWTRIRDTVEELQADESKFKAYDAALRRNVFLSE